MVTTIKKVHEKVSKASTRIHQKHKMFSPSLQESNNIYSTLLTLPYQLA